MFFADAELDAVFAKANRKVNSTLSTQFHIQTMIFSAGRPDRRIFSDEHGQERENQKAMGSAQAFCVSNDLFRFQHFYVFADLTG